MNKRDLFVFSGQSNMMGAAVFPPKKAISVEDCYEYKHKARRLGAERGDFVKAGYPCGEFSYIEEAMKTAYLPENTDSEGRSTLDHYTQNTYFCPSMCSFKSLEPPQMYSFEFFSESNPGSGPSMAPMFAEEWEKRGQKCAYAHIAKGNVTIAHYFNGDMMDEYNRRAEEYNKEHELKLEPIVNKNPMCLGASAYFDKKVKDFFADAEERFAGDDMSNKIFVWCQGESDCVSRKDKYKTRMEVLWNHLKELGFTHFFCVRVGYWSVKVENNLHEIMQAQEEFCRENDNCYIITRAMSCMAHKDIDGKGWFTEEPTEEYQLCRDNYFGFSNAHINEKGFSVIAERVAYNAVRVLREGKEPLLEKEIVAKLVKSENIK